MQNTCIRILVILGLIALVCGVAGAAEINVGTGPHVTSGVEAPVCTVPGDMCISETDAIQRWGVSGYEMSSKTICGQSADAMIQFYCIHPLGQPAAGAAPAPAAPAGTPAAAAPVSSPAAAATAKSPLDAALVPAALGAALLAASGVRRR